MSAPPSRKVFLTVILILSGLLLIGGVLLTWMRPHQNPSPRLTLPDGSTVIVAGATFGTNHVHGSVLGRWIASMPSAVQDILPGLGPHLAFQSLNTPVPALVIWIDLPKLTNAPPGTASSGWYEVYLGDTNGLVSGPAQGLPFVGMGQVFGLRFSAFPRRDREFTLHVFTRDAQGNEKDCGSLPVLNPAYHAYPRWQPETLPTTHRAGDVEATLEMFSTKNEILHMSWSGSVGMTLSTILHLRPVTDTNQIWRLDHVVLSDALSNVVQDTGVTSTGSSGDDTISYAFQPGLWTNETAWKLRCEIKRTKGFAPGEMFTFKNIPLGALNQTNQFGWTTNLNGVTVTLDYFVRRPPSTNAYWSSDKLSLAHFSVSGTTNDLYLDLLETRTDNGASVECPSSGSSGTSQDRYLRNIPLEAKTLDFTFAVHRGRSVEFLVNPEAGPERFGNPASPKPPK
jgi:hypothetical protein